MESDHKLKLNIKFCDISIHTLRMESDSKNAQYFKIAEWKIAHFSQIISLKTSMLNL